MGEQNSDFGVFQNKTPIEIGKTQEGLNVFNLSGFRPILNDLDLVGGHGETAQRKDIAYILDCIDMEETFVGAGV